MAFQRSLVVLIGVVAMCLVLPGCLGGRPADTPDSQEQGEIDTVVDNAEGGDSTDVDENGGSPCDVPNDPGCCDPVLDPDCDAAGTIVVNSLDQTGTTDGLDGNGVDPEVASANLEAFLGVSNFYLKAYTYMLRDTVAGSPPHHGSNVVGVGSKIVALNQDDRSTTVFSCPMTDAGNQAMCVSQVDSDTCFVGGINSTGDGTAGGYTCSQSSQTCTASAGFDSSYSFQDGVTACTTTDPPSGSGRTAFVARSNFLAGTLQKGVYKSTDGGRNFTRITAGLPSFLSVYKFARTGSVVLTATGSGIYRSTDQGSSWTKITSGVPSGQVADIRPVGSAVYAAINATTPNVYKSTDAGATWHPTGAGIVATRLNGLTSNRNGVFAATNGGLFKSKDAGASWQQYGKGLSFSSHLKMYVAGNTILTGTFGNRNGVLRSTDYGLTWTGGGAAVAFKTIRALWASGSVVLAAGESGLFKSTDGGASFAAVAPGPAGLPTSGVFIYAFTSVGSTVLGVLSTGGVYKSTNLGDTWTLSSTGLPAGVSGASLVSNGNTVVMGSASAVYRSLDGGATWNLVAPPTSSTPYSVYSLLYVGSTLYAGTFGFGFPDSHGLFRSTDDGTTWTRLTNGIPSNTPVYALAAADGRVFAGLAKGLFVSNDGGSSWQSFGARYATKSIFSLATGPSGLSALAGDRTAELAAQPTRLYVGTGSAGIFIPLLVPPAQRLVPIVLDVDNGSSAHFTTELALTNRGSTPATLTYLYTGSIGGGTGTAADTLAAGQQLVVSDAISYLRGKGVPIPAGNVGGTLLVTFDGLSETNAASITARTTTATTAPQPVGAAGLAYSALDPARATAGVQTLYGLRSTASDRSNVAIFNVGSLPVALKVTAWNGDGSGASTVIENVTLPAYGWKQYTRILEGPNYTTGWVTVERTSTTGAFGTYGVINDNGTSDGSFVVPADDLARPQFMNVPVLVELSAFLSELVLTNASATPATFILTYQESLSTGGGSGGTANVAVPARTQLIFPSAIAELRRRGVAIGPAGAANYAGSLHVFVQGAPVNKTFAGARTASPSPESGQFGLFTPAFASGTEASDTAYIYGLRADENNRSNVAVINTGTTSGAGPITLQLQAYDGEAGGAAAGSFDSLTLQPGQWSQSSGFLANKGVRNGWVKITRSSGTAPWIAYGVVNDGGGPGQRTGDGAYVPMTR